MMLRVQIKKVRGAEVEINTDRKWKAYNAVNDTEARLKQTRMWGRLLRAGWD